MPRSLLFLALSLVVVAAAGVANGHRESSAPLIELPRPIEEPRLANCDEVTVAAKSAATASPGNRLEELASEAIAKN